ncbi:MAG: transcriptional repressor LexA [Limnochordia bacterium]|jgi:repressor LexA|nr:transcriptional repressor LexA [Limnochordia bacterium]MDD2630820.1 transcriptional repressor LexA [Limnochordia bacterium]
MNGDLTVRQREILEIIKQHVEANGYPPSVREIASSVGLKSTSTVHGHLVKLEQKGYLRRDPSKPRALEITDKAGSVPRDVVSVPIVGNVTAGEPILATENIEEHFALPKDFIRTEENVFMLRVQGSSMIGAGILDNDFVLVKQQNAAYNGDIVVAMLDDEVTVKRFYRETDTIRLQPENPSMEPIYSSSVAVLGKVIGVLRRFE